MTAVPVAVTTTERVSTPTPRTSSPRLPTTSYPQPPTRPPFTEVTTTPPPRGGTGGMSASPAVTAEAAPDAVVLGEEPVMPLIFPPPDPDSSTLDVVTAWSPNTPRQAKGAFSTVEPHTSPPPPAPLPTPFPVGEPPESHPFPDRTEPPGVGPSQRSQSETGGGDPYPEVPLWSAEEMDVPTESAVHPGNETFSAATVLSGDGEIDHTPQSYPHLLDSDVDYQYGPADGFLPVSSASICCCLCTSSSPPSHFTSCSLLALFSGHFFFLSQVFSFSSNLFFDNFSV